MSGKSGKSSWRKLTTKQSRERLRSHLVRGVRWTLFLGALAISVYGLLLLSTTSMESTVFQLNELEYSGVDHLEVGPLNDMIERTFPRNVLQIDLEDLRNLVESENWVKAASVRRRLPNRIQIHVQERKPVAVAALESELQVVDEDGVLLAPYGADFEFLDLPIVRGLQNTALENAQHRNARRMKVFLQLIEEFRAADSNTLETLSEIDVSDIERVAVVPLADPVPVVLGDRLFRRRYQVFLDQIDLYREVRESSGAVELIDVTFEDKIIIQTGQGKETSGVES